MCWHTYIYIIFIYTKELQCRPWRNSKHELLPQYINMQRVSMCAYVSMRHYLPNTKPEAALSAGTLKTPCAGFWGDGTHSGRFRERWRKWQSETCSQGSVRKPTRCVYSYFEKLVQTPFAFTLTAWCRSHLKCVRLNIWGYESTNTGAHTAKGKTLCLCTALHLLTFCSC